MTNAISYRLAPPLARAPYAAGYRAPTPYAPLRPVTLYRANPLLAATAALYRSGVIAPRLLSVKGYK